MTAMPVRIFGRGGDRRPRLTSRRCDRDGDKVKSLLRQIDVADGRVEAAQAVLDKDRQEAIREKANYPYRQLRDSAALEVVLASRTREADELKKAHQAAEGTLASRQRRELSKSQLLALEDELVGASKAADAAIATLLKAIPALAQVWRRAIRDLGQDHEVVDIPLSVLEAGVTTGLEAWRSSPSAKPERWLR